MINTNKYFIGFNRRSEDVLSGLFDMGATLMFYYHLVTRDLNARYGFYDGEWMLYTCENEQDIEKVKSFLESKVESIKDFKFKIISVN